MIITVKILAAPKFSKKNTAHSPAVSSPAVNSWPPL